MNIENNYNEKIDVQRLTVLSGNKKDYQEHLLDILCHIQPLDPSISSDIEGGFGKDLLMFTDVADIQEGDRVIRGTKTYRVIGVEKYDNFRKRVHHMEVIIRIFQS